METEDLAKQLMLVFTNMQKNHVKHHIMADTKRSVMAIIAVLDAHKDQDGLMITDISKRLNLPPSAITPVINDLEEKNLIVRKNSPTDRRIVLVQLTEQGLAFFEKKQEMFYRKAILLCKHLGEEDTREFIRIFTKASAFMNTMDEKDCDHTRNKTPDNNL
ncbi:MAG: MarR family transcriptional regulator [Eubacteriales bacterium]